MINVRRQQWRKERTQVIFKGIHFYLYQMEVIRITTAGSVDDGKSTLIGRLLFDTKSIAEDKLQAIESSSLRKGLGYTDLSLLTDGLIAEREQGITIDVAYIYFSTPQRKFIIADTPGHIEYTRNMVTGASTAPVFLILVDARNGITEQTRRHFYIASLLRIRYIAVCVNKMDLVDFAESVYLSIVREFESLASKTTIPGQQLLFVPIVATHGDNVAMPSARMDWYNGPTLLQYLETVDVFALEENQFARMAVQYVIRPHQPAFHDFRGYSGRVVSGVFSKGDKVLALPSMKSSTITSILYGSEEVEHAGSRESVVLSLQDDIDISRGNMLIKEVEPLKPVTVFDATLCWMEDTKLATGKVFVLQHGVNRVKAKIESVHSILDIHTMEPNRNINQFGLNDIGRVRVKLAKPIFAELYSDNPSNGSFILIDEFSNNTVAVGFVDQTD